MEVERRARWNDDVVTSIVEIPVLDEDTKSVLFYSKTDYLDFQEKEQKRYDKMMGKQIQKMVYDAMGPQIQQAMDRGATPEEIEAMMPQTTEEIFQLLGGLPTLTMPAQLRAAPIETLHKSTGSDANNTLEHLDGGVQVLVSNEVSANHVHHTSSDHGLQSPTVERQSDSIMFEVTPDRECDFHASPTADMILDMPSHTNREIPCLDASRTSPSSIRTNA